MSLTMKTAVKLLLATAFLASIRCQGESDHSCEGYEGIYTGWAGKTMALRVTVGNDRKVTLQAETLWPYDHVVLDLKGAFTTCEPGKRSLLSLSGGQFLFNITWADQLVEGKQLQVVFLRPPNDTSGPFPLQYRHMREECDLPHMPKQLPAASQGGRVMRQEVPAGGAIDVPTADHLCDLTDDFDDNGQLQARVCIGKDGTTKETTEFRHSFTGLKFCRNTCLEECKCAAIESANELKSFDAELYGYHVGAYQRLLCGHDTLTKTAGFLECSVKNFHPVNIGIAPECGGVPVCDPPCESGNCIADGSVSVCNCTSATQDPNNGCQEGGAGVSTRENVLLKWWWLLLIIVAITVLLLLLACLCWRHKQKSKPVHVAVPDTDDLVADDFDFEQAVQVVDPSILITGRESTTSL